MGNVPGIIFIGICFGFALLRLYRELKFDLISVEGIVFLMSPIALFLLTSINHDLINIKFNSNFFWILFLFVYLVMGAVLFIKNNSNDSTNTEKFLVSLCVPYIILSLFINFAALGIRYSSDSYSYYDMSKSIFSDFGLVSTTRQYMEFTDYGISFPYLYPMIISIFNSLTGFGIFSGTCINVIVALISLYYFLKISIKLAQSTIPGLIVSIVLFFNPDYLGEMIRARAIPLSILCALLIINIVVNAKELTKKKLFLIGLFAGAGIVIRFDFLVISGLLGVVLVFVLRKNIFKMIPFYIFGLLVFSAPWIIYSFAHFKKLWVSDNSGTMFLINPVNPLNFYLPDEVIPTLFSNWNEWLLNHQKIIMRGVAGLCSIIVRPIEIIMILGMTGIGIISKNNGDYARKNFKTIKILLLLVLLIYSAKTFSIMVVGYGDLRYHVEALVIVSLIILCSLFYSFANYKAWTCLIGLILVISITNNLQPAFQKDILPKIFGAFIDIAAITPNSSTKEIEQILVENGGFTNNRDIRLFFLDGNSFVIGAYTGIKCYANPYNLNKERLLYLVENYIKPDYIFALEKSKKWIEVLSEHYLINPISANHPLYRLMDLSDFVIKGIIRASNLTDRNWKNGIGQSTQIVLFENTYENYKKLKNAKYLKAESISIRISEIAEVGKWIHVKCEGSVNLEPFAHPNEIIIIE